MPFILLHRDVPIDEGAAEAPLDLDPPPVVAAAPQDTGRRRAVDQGADGVDGERQRPRHRRAKAGALQLGGLVLGLGPRGGGGTTGK